MWDNGAMLLPVAYHRVLRLAALGVWAVLAVPVVWGFIRHKYHHFPQSHFELWLIAFAIFGPALWLSSRIETRNRQFLKVAALAIETATALATIYLLPDYWMGFLLVIVSWQLALFFTMSTAILWALVQTALLLWIYVPTCNFGWGWAITTTYIGFQVFAMVTAFVARSEATLRQVLGRTNAELQATRELLAESARGAERVRIAGELHDLLGHNLTALSLHLEVASHKVDGDARQHIQHAQGISKSMLGDVRGVVTALRRFESMDVCRALNALIEGVPHIQIHLTYPDGLHIEDAERAQILLRCVQEIITNVLKHSGAEHLWIEIAPTEDGLELRARDDGKGQHQPIPGLGLSTMRERLEAVGGKLSFESQPKAGFRLSAWLPIAMGSAS
jgi:signal transduction histidine kinase